MLAHRPSQHARSPLGSAWSRLVVALVVLAGALAPDAARAAVRMYPSELYGGMNVITLSSDKGIRRILYKVGSGWREARNGLQLPNLRFVSVPSPRNCPKQVKVYIFVEHVSDDAEVTLRTEECNGGGGSIQSLELGTLWEVDHQEMGAVRVGKTVCTPFRVSAVGDRAVTVDRVVVPTGNFQLRFSEGKPPLRIGADGLYRYDVCFRADRPGRYKMPIHVYIRRRQPNGGFNSFIVADTAYVTVLGPPPQAPVRRPPATTPRRPPPRRPPPSVIDPPRPIIVPDPPPPPRIPDVDTTAPRLAARPVIPVETEALREPPEMAVAGYGREITDPTTFRTIVLPTARSVGAGRSFVASYDVAGILAGYGVTDRLTVIGGGLVIPAFVGARTVDVTAGARYELHRGDYLRVAGGVQLNHSDTDSSAITLAAPYVVASLGDDDRRASVALSYTARRHDPVSGDPFTREAIVVAAGGDLRIGGNWKVAAEAIWIQASTYQPVIGTVRYFGERFAVDAGAVVNVGSGETTVAPVVSVVVVFGE
jgi:hypothetical protein